MLIRNRIYVMLSKPISTQSHCHCPRPVITEGGDTLLALRPVRARATTGFFDDLFLFIGIVTKPSGV
jgi:hypothetical protein